MAYISRMTNTTMPWIKASPTEEKELEGEYNAHETIIILTPGVCWKSAESAMRKPPGCVGQGRRTG